MKSIFDTHTYIVFLHFNTPPLASSPFTAVKAQKQSRDLKTMVKVRTTKPLLAGTNQLFPSTNVVLAFVTRLEANSAVREVIESLVDNVAKICV